LQAYVRICFEKIPTEQLGYVQSILADVLSKVTGALLNYLVLKEAPDVFISTTEFVNAHCENTVVYLEGFLLTMLVIAITSSCLSRPKSKVSSKARPKIPGGHVKKIKKETEKKKEVRAAVTY
jgi:hypothetical protein